MKIPGLYKKNGLYWYQSPMNQGVRPKPFSLGTKDESEALLKLGEVHDSPVEVDTFSHEVKKYLAAKLATRRISPSLADVRAYTLSAFASSFKIANPSKITPQIVQEYYDGLLSRGLSETTAQTYIFALRAFCRWLKDQRKIQFNPCEKVEMNRLVKKFHNQFCTKDQVDLLLCDAPPELKFVLLCGFDAGMRKNEIVECRPEWFSSHGIIHIQNCEGFESKDGDIRHVPLTDRFTEFLRSYGHPRPYMIAPWKKVKGKSRYRYDFRRPFDDHVKRHGLEWVSPHVMRHTFASLRVQAGVSIYKVAKWLGDGVQVVQNHYGHLAPIYDRDIEV